MRRGLVSGCDGLGGKRSVVVGLSHIAMSCKVLAWLRRAEAGACTSEVLEQLDFAQGTLGQDLLAEDVGDLFDGDALARLVVGSRTAGHNQHEGRCIVSLVAAHQTMP